MKTFAVKTTIRATPERVWKLLTDAPGYPRWNNTVQKVEGRIALGQRVTVHPKINAGRAFPVTVAEFQPLRRNGMDRRDATWSLQRPEDLRPHPWRK